MRIAVDAMGGDQAPAKIIHGALDALPLLDPDDQLILVGNQTIIEQHAGPALQSAGAKVRIEPASQVITMDDSPVEAIRSKRDSSIVRMVKLGKEHKADALISAGNTGALVAAGVLMLKPLAGVERPGIAVYLPSSKGAVMLCDAGANTQPKPAHLYQYAVMARLYVKATKNIDNPSVALLNIGTEEEKGTPLVKEARQLLAADPALNFQGYVESRDIPNHPADVIVTDGFTGNVVLKLVEGWSGALFKTLQQEAAAEGPDFLHKLKPLMGRIAKRYDHEEYGGALLLGVQGLFMKVHGSAGPRAIKNAIAATKSAARLNVNQQIEHHLAPKH
ncbi:MAG TPA: phosphate acyltransferase PlsX [Phycisphaerae bacterium]|nr:phosphate acyltransferase PlsX [Phycisphaerae bacterium]